ELGDGGRVRARGLEEVGDFEDVAGDLQVAVAVHGERWFLWRRGGGKDGAACGRSADAGEGRPGGSGGGCVTAESGTSRRRPERGGGSTAAGATATANAGSTGGPGGAGRGECQVREHAHKDSGSHPHCQLD